MFYKYGKFRGKFIPVYAVYSYETHSSHLSIEDSIQVQQTGETPAGRMRRTILLASSAAAAAAAVNNAAATRDVDHELCAVSSSALPSPEPSSLTTWISKSLLATSQAAAAVPDDLFDRDDCGVPPLPEETEVSIAFPKSANEYLSLFLSRVES